MDVQFDENSKAILKKVDAIHRDSLINVALAIVANTGYYKTLTGDAAKELAGVASLSSLDELEAELDDIKPKQKATPKKAATNWDNF